LGEKEINFVYEDGKKLSVFYDADKKGFVEDNGSEGYAIENATADKYVVYNAKDIADKAYNYFHSTVGEGTVDKSYVDKNGLCHVVILDENGADAAHYDVDVTTLTGKETISDTQVDLSQY
jgi:hypothetical protein